MIFADGPRMMLRRFGPANFVALLPLLLALACTTTPGSKSATRDSQSAAAAPGNCVRHNLQADEQAGGHSLRKHIGRTDDELRQRLERERNISGSSTYTDLAAAECAVGGALAEDADKILRWANREGGHSNFVSDFDSPTPIGRTLNRGEDVPRSCNHAKVVLQWDGPGSYHVLTTYPECR